MVNLRKQIKNLDIDAKRRQKADFDPEDEPFSKQAASDDESGSDESVEEDVGREHYESVGKSKLRKPEKTKLDETKYGGQAVSRDKIFQDVDDGDGLAPNEEDDEDPFAAPAGDLSRSDEDDPDEVNEEDEMLDGEDVNGEGGTDEEIESDEAFEDGEEDEFRGKGFVFRGSGKGLKSLPTGSEEDTQGEEEESDGVAGSSEDDQSDFDMEDMNEISDEDDEEGDIESSLEDEDDGEDESAARPRPSTIKHTGTSDREALKALISSDTATLASSLSASLSADAKKGAAVRTQYKTFDRLLDARIKLQKGFTASNDLHQIANITDEEAQRALQKAEEAALKLYATIESLRHSILEANASPSTDGVRSELPASKKRKRPSPPTSSTSTDDLWKRLSTLETRTLPTRNQTLDKWSSKTRSAAPLASSSSANPTSKLNADNPQSKLSTVLSAYLQTETPKLLVPLSSTSPPQTPYDDTAFYQSLLRDLIASRSSTNPNGTSGAPSNIPVLPLKLHPSGNTAKNKRVDTKASKGRKIRYTVHEKLENFMASEGRGNAVGQWNEGAVREFFGSLLGQRGMLGEDVDGYGDLVEDVDAADDREVEALKLFRS